MHADRALCMIMSRGLNASAELCRTRRMKRMFESKMRFFLVAFAALVLVLASPVEAKMSEEARQHSGRARAKIEKEDDSHSRYEISVITFGPGDQAFFKFGHNAIWVSDRQRKKDFVYNFGTFGFHSGTLISEFIQGRLRYWVSVKGLRQALLSYEEEGRSATAQVLNLSPEQEKTLAIKLRRGARRKNREFAYHYYENNCSTRVRDLVNEITNGSLRAVSTGAAGFTWREHTMRLTQDALPVSLALDLVLGPGVDEKNTVWEEMFLPSILNQTLRAAVVDTEGRRSPLVSHEYEVLSDARPPEPTAPPLRWPWMLAASLSLGAFTLIQSLRAASKKNSPQGRKRSRRIVWTAAFVSGLFLGGLGCCLSYLWLATNHEITYFNENILQFSPLALLLPVLVLVRAFAPAGVPAAERYAFLVSVACAFLALGGAVLGALIGWTQDTREFVAFAIPLWVSLAFAFYKLAESESSRVR